MHGLPSGWLRISRAEPGYTLPVYNLKACGRLQSATGAGSWQRSCAASSRAMGPGATPQLAREVGMPPHCRAGGAAQGADTWLLANVDAAGQTAQSCCSAPMARFITRISAVMGSLGPADGSSQPVVAHCHPSRRQLREHPQTIEHLPVSIHSWQHCPDTSKVLPVDATMGHWC